MKPREPREGEMNYVNEWENKTSLAHFIPLSVGSYIVKKLYLFLIIAPPEWDDEWREPNQNNQNEKQNENCVAFFSIVYGIDPFSTSRVIIVNCFVPIEVLFSLFHIFAIRASAINHALHRILCSREFCIFVITVKFFYRHWPPKFLLTALKPWTENSQRLQMEIICHGRVSSISPIWWCICRSLASWFIHIVYRMGKL